MPHILKLVELRGDRFFALVKSDLRAETKNSVAEGWFHPVSSLLHHLPQRFVDYTEAGSFKTEDAFGNLQITFFMKGEECLADIDIDDGAGLAHIFQVVRNSVSGRPTHPYDIREILIHHQKLDPGYRFQV